MPALPPEALRAACLVFVAVTALRAPGLWALLRPLGIDLVVAMSLLSAVAVGLVAGLVHVDLRLEGFAARAVQLDPGAPHPQTLIAPGAGK